MTIESLLTEQKTVERRIHQTVVFLVEDDGDVLHDPAMDVVDPALEERNRLEQLEFRDLLALFTKLAQLVSRIPNNQECPRF